MAMLDNRMQHVVVWINIVLVIFIFPASRVLQSVLV